MVRPLARILLLTTPLWLRANPPAGQPSPPLPNPEPLVAIALEENAGLAALRARVLRLKEVPIQVGSLPDPMLEIAPLGQMAETAAGETTLMAGISQRFPFPGKRKERSETANLMVLAVSHDLEAAEIALIEKVRITWWEGFRIQENLRLIGETKALLESFRDTVDSRVAAGKSSQTDQLRLSNEITGLDRDLIASRQRQHSLDAQMNALLNRESTHPLPMLSPPSTVLLPKREIPDVKDHPLLQAAQCRLEASRHRQNGARLERFPDLTLGAKYAGVSSSGLSPVADGTDQFYATLGVNLPLWQSPRKAMVKEAVYEGEERAAELQQLEFDLRFQREEAGSRVHAWQETLNLFDGRLLPDAQQAFQLALSAYVSEKADLNEVIDTWRMLLQYQLQRADAVTHLHRADAAWRAATGQRD